ncbi:MAG: ATP-binding protein, partial [Cyanobacteria bacterium HKST-UBA03]|nr:ATP-binding protein [Cyanobacteria bacterium HKST-UBA03]
MITLQMPLEKITEKDLQKLIGFSEDKHYDFKELILQTEKEFLGDSQGEERATKKKEYEKLKAKFLANVVSFANGEGGDLYFGISEDENKYANEIVGIDADDEETLWLRLDSLIRNKIEHPLPNNYSKVFVPLKNNKKVLILRIFESWNKPHRETITNRFTLRHIGGKHDMTITELKESFLFSEKAYDKMLSFHQERVDLILKKEVPIKLYSHPRMLMMIMPMASFTNIYPTLSVNIFNENHPTAISGAIDSNFRINLEGWLAIQKARIGTTDNYENIAFIQVYRNGVVELQDSVFHIVNGSIDREGEIDTWWFVRNILMFLKTSIDSLKKHELLGP